MKRWTIGLGMTGALLVLGNGCAKKDTAGSVPPAPAPAASNDADADGKVDSADAQRAAVEKLREEHERQMAEHKASQEAAAAERRKTEEKSLLAGDTSPTDSNTLLSGERTAALRSSRGTFQSPDTITIIRGKAKQKTDVDAPPEPEPKPADIAENSHPPVFDQHAPNPFVTASEDHLSTFAIDVDTASYTFARRSLLEGQLPDPAGVRVEEFLNYFHYDYPAPTKDRAFSINMDAAPSPFAPKRTLLRVGLQGRKVSISQRKPAHLTFLVDVSGSMQGDDRLPLAQRALRILVDNLHDGDTVGLVTYAGSVREVLPPTELSKKAEIHAAIASLSAGGSTAMGDGLQLAYRQALRLVKPGHVSRVIVLTDGDANVGLTSHAEILKTISGAVKEGVTLSTIGFGMGNYRDDMLEQLADKGNGNYFYVDGISQARRVFQEQLGGTLEVIAKDVKIQVDFDPKVVAKYRLVGYENRAIADRDFRDDKVDAGEIGAGHSVTAMYEVELTGTPGALATVRVRAKQPEGHVAAEWAEAFPTSAISSTFDGASPDFRFATAVMASAEILRRSPVAAGWKWGDVERIAKQAVTAPVPERVEFLMLLEKARGVVGPMAMR